MNVSHNATRPLTRIALLAIASFGVFSCADTSHPTSPFRPTSRLDTEVAPQLVTFYGPQRFFRNKGKPGAQTATISTLHYEAPFTIHIRNGDANGDNAISSGSISLDGTELVGSSDFSNHGNEWSFPVTLGASAQLAVELKSKPGDFVDIWVEGVKSKAVFCPGRVGAYDDLSDAIDASDVGGTVLVCNGTWDIDEETINKPITVRSENLHGATLRDSDPHPSQQNGRPAIWVDGVASGLVRIADISFTIGGRGVVMRGTYDQVQLDSVDVGPKTAGSFTTTGVMAFISSVSGARVDVIRSGFRGLSIGLFPVNSVEFNVSYSTFSNMLGGSVIYSGNGVVQGGPISGSHGTVSDNLFTNCANYCLGFLNSEGALVTRNRFENTGTALVFQGAIRVSRFVQPVHNPIVIEDNDIVGARIAATPAGTNGWTYPSGVSLIDNPGNMDIVRNNRISGTYTGIVISGDVTATDNTINNGFYLFRQQIARQVSFNRNDGNGNISSFLTASGVPVRNFKCNWWGSASGPTTPPVGTAALYTPFAIAPIANTATVCAQ